MSNRLTNSELTALHGRFLAGDSSAGWDIVYSCTRLIASKCQRYEGYLGTDTDELVQEFYVQLFEKLGDWKPAEKPLSHFVLRLLNKSSYFCRKLACRPKVHARCNEFKQDLDYNLSELPGSSSSAVCEMLSELDDAIEASDVSPEGIEALRCRMLGYTLPETREHLAKHNPELVKGGANQWERKIRELTDESIAKIQEVTGTVSTERSLSKARLTEDEFERIVRLLLESEPISYGGAVGLIRSHGIVVSIGFTRDTFIRHRIRERRASIQSLDDIEAVLAQIMAERRKHMGVKLLPSAEEAEIPDALWNRLERLFAGRNFQDARARTNQVLYRLRSIRGFIRQEASTETAWRLCRASLRPSRLHLIRYWVMRKVRAGEPLSVAARDWNKLVDLAGIAQGNSVNPGVQSANTLGLIWVWVKNNSGSDRTRFDCMGLGDLVFDVETNAQQDVIFKAETAATSRTPIILQEPIGAGRIGRAAISGVTLAKVATSTHVGLIYAAANATGHNLLPSAGPIKLLAAPSTSAATLRPVALGPFYPIFPVKTKAACPAGGSVSCDLFIASPGGSKADSGLDVTVYNPGGPIVSGAMAEAHLNGAGDLEFIVVKCVNA